MRRRPRPLLAAALIVRDEADQISGCLASVIDKVDEAVVYDTGSRDGTPALARSAGARVLSGSWDGDFARARNAAAAMTRAHWVLSVDADERLMAEGDAVRSLLAGHGGDARALEDLDAFAVRVRHVSDVGRELVTQDVVRLFRPDRARWRGRVHEVVDVGDGRGRVARLRPSLAFLEHRGYGDDATVRAKAERNLALAQAELDELVARHSPDRQTAARVLFDLARCQLAVGRRQDAVDALETLREIVETGVRRALATALLAQILLDEGGFEEVALVLEAELRGDGTTDPRLADWIRAQALAGLGRTGQALDLLRGIDRLVDASGAGRPLAPVLRARARLAVPLGHRGEARTVLLSAVVEHGPVEGDLDLLLALFEGDAEELIRALHELGGPFLSDVVAALREQGTPVGADVATG